MAQAPLADAVRVSDPDRYVSALYAPADKRQALFALAAFDAEIAGIRDRIREALPGEIRLQWWRDALGKRGEATGHPLADALIGVIDAYRLSVRTFEDYLDARIFDLYNDPMPSRNDLEGYCGETTSAIIQLGAMILDPDAAPRFAGLAGRAGCAQAITGLVRRLPLHRSRGQCYVPQDLLAATGTSVDRLLAGEDDVAAATGAMLALAESHLVAFEAGAVDIPGTLRPAFLPLAITGAQLRALSSGRGGARGDISAWHKHWLLLRCAIRGWPKER